MCPWVARGDWISDVTIATIDNWILNILLCLLEVLVILPSVWIFIQETPDDVGFPDFSLFPNYVETTGHRYGTDGGSCVMCAHFRVSCESVSGLFRKRLACLPGTSSSSTFFWRMMQLQYCQHPLCGLMCLIISGLCIQLCCPLLERSKSYRFVINHECGWKTICAIAEGSFDPPTLGLWAQCASSAPFRCLTLVRENDTYTQSILLHWERSNMNLWIKKYLCRELMTDIIILKKRCQNSRRQPRTKILHWLAMHFSDDFRTTQW